jgi:hypothetical protein
LKQQSDAQNEDWLARYKALKAEAHRLTQSTSIEIASSSAERSKKPFGVTPDTDRGLLETLGGSPIYFQPGVI